MGLFSQTILFPGGGISECRTALEKAAEIPDLYVDFEKCFWHLYAKGPAVLLNDDCCGYEDLAKNLSASVVCPVMLIYIYDDDFWGYFLFQKGIMKDEFASVTDYFKKGSPPNKPGRAGIVSQLFDVPVKSIERYVIPIQYGEDYTDLFAYETDTSPIGDSWQMADFMNALGFDYDLLCVNDVSAPEITSTASRSYEGGSITSAFSRENSADTPVLPQQAKNPNSGRIPVDTPILPSVLTDYEYIINRAKEVQELAGPAIQMIGETQLKEAVPLLTEAIRNNPHAAALYLLRAFCWAQMENTNFGLSRKPDIDRDLSKALELEPNNIMILRARFPTAATTKRCQRHIVELTRLMELDPENIDIYQEARAYRYHWVGDDDSARRDLQEILDRGKLWTVDLVYLCREFGMPGF